jgi:hypothetical protein
MGFVGVAVTVVMGMGVAMGMRIRMGVWATVRVRRGASRDRHDSLVGYATTFPLSEHSQPSQNTSE